MEEIRYIRVDAPEGRLSLTTSKELLKYLLRIGVKFFSFRSLDENQEIDGRLLMSLKKWSCGKKSVPVVVSYRVNTNSEFDVLDIWDFNLETVAKINGQLSFSLVEDPFDSDSGLGDWIFFSDKNAIECAVDSHSEILYLRKTAEACSLFDEISYPYKECTL